MAATAFATATLLHTGRRCAIPLTRARARRYATMATPAAASPAAYEQMSALLREVSTLHSALGILGWDEQTMLPPGAADARARQKAALAGVAHEKASAPALGDAIAACEAEIESVGDAYARANVRDARRGFDQTTRVSKALAMEKEAAESEGYAAWAAARAANDWAGFAPTLVKVLDVFKRYAAATRPEMESYDAAIDMFERGMTADRLSAVFDELAPPLKDLLDRVSAARATAPPVEDMLKGGKQWDIDAQARLCKKLAERLNFDFDKGRIDVSHHPFTGGAGPEGWSDLELLLRLLACVDSDWTLVSDPVYLSRSSFLCVASPASLGAKTLVSPLATALRFLGRESWVLCTRLGKSHARAKESGYEAWL